MCLSCVCSLHNIYTTFSFLTLYITNNDSENVLLIHCYKTRPFPKSRTMIGQVYLRLTGINSVCADFGAPCGKRKNLIKIWFLSQNSQNTVMVPIYWLIPRLIPPKFSLSPWRISPLSCSESTVWIYLWCCQPHSWPWHPSSFPAASTTNK